MSWISESLMNGESIVYEGHLHWIMFAPGIFLVVIGAACSAGVPVLGVLLILGGIFSLIGAAIRQATTEIAVTNKRVLGKTGFIRRDTIDLNLSKVESLYADQGILGRMLDYGAVRIKGTGGSNFIVKSVSTPIAYKKAANEQIDAMQSQ